MTRRKIRKLGLSTALLIIALLIAASFIATNDTVKIVLLLSILIMATALLVAYIFQGWADQERLQADIDRLRREFEVDRALVEARTGRIEADLQRLKQDLFSELAVRSMDLDNPGFTEAINELLIEPTPTGKDRDG